MRHTSDGIIRKNVRHQVLLKLWLPTHEDAIAPSGYTILSGRVVKAAPVVILVSRVEVEGALSKHAEDRMLLARLEQLVFLLESCIVLLKNKSANFVVRQIDTEVHVAKQKFVVMISFLARGYGTEVVEHLLVDNFTVLEAIGDG